MIFFCLSTRIRYRPTCLVSGLEEKIKMIRINCWTTTIYLKAIRNHNTSTKIHIIYHVLHNVTVQISLRQSYQVSSVRWTFKPISNVWFHEERVTNFTPQRLVHGSSNIFRRWCSCWMWQTWISCWPVRAGLHHVVHTLEIMVICVPVLQNVNEKQEVKFSLDSCSDAIIETMFFTIDKTFLFNIDSIIEIKTLLWEVNQWFWTVRYWKNMMTIKCRIYQ